MNERVVLVLGNILFICENCHSTGCFSRLHLGEWKSDISISLPHACTLHYLAWSGAFLTFWSECHNLTKLSEIPDGVTKFWQKCKNFCRFCLKQFRNMVRMSEFLTFWSYIDWSPAFLTAWLYDQTVRNSDILIIFLNCVRI